MGYTHYWYRPAVIDQALFSRIRSDFENVVRVLAQLKGIYIAGGDGQGEPEITNNVIYFNGSGDESCEPFYFPRIVEANDYIMGSGHHGPQGTFFCFCKTRQAPYDLAVTACLLVIKQYLGDHIIVRSDGEDKDWIDARMFCHIVLDYDLDRFSFNKKGELTQHT